jgi:AraC-like DNA-binding protein
MGRLVVSENISIELYSVQDLPRERETLEIHEIQKAHEIHKGQSTRLATAFSEEQKLPEPISALYRYQFDSTSFVLGERDDALEIIFRISPNNFLFDLEGVSYQIHILFKVPYFSRFAYEKEENLNISTGSLIPKKLREHYYSPLFISCESQSSLYQLVEIGNQLKGINPREIAVKDWVILESVAVKLLVECMEVTERLTPVCGTCAFLEKADSGDKIQEAMNFIQSNFRETITIPQIAKEVGINQCYLKKGFKEMYGKTIYSMVQTLRMEMAHEFLKNSSLNILEIALEVGYTNAASFSTAFKQFYGYSPQQLRAL